MMLYKIEKPFVFTVFGASGDLAKIKIFPALYALAEQKRFPKDFWILGYARTPKSDEDFRQEFRDSVMSRREEPVDEKILDELLEHVYYFEGQYDDPKSFQGFAKEILKKSKADKVTTMTYLAVPPQAFSGIVKNLAEIRPQIGEDLRLIIEKPFGTDEKSARELFHNVSIYFDADKVFLLDHYLGKEAVQSILALRYANGILNTLLSGRLIANIQITAAEDLNVANRISYFDQVGIIKDMIQSHLLQMLSLLTMELPVEQEADSVHREKIAILSALKYRGYEKAMVIGQHENYKKIPGVKKDSKTPTFAAIRLFIDRQDWYKVPIYIRTGKMLNKKHTYVVVEFKKHRFQRKNPDIHPNRLILELQPNERIHLKLYTKVGGVKDQFHDLTTSESLACFGDDCLPEHGRLLLNVFQNDQSNFLSFEEIIATWMFTDKLFSCCENRDVKIYSYEDYSEGPSEQHHIPHDDGFEWFDVPLKKT
jgi:glucose-6-phosphate 1-dehydrogenase